MNKNAPKNCTCLLSKRNLINVEYITKTSLHKFDTLKPHFYIVNLGFTGVYIIFCLFCLKT